MVWSGSWPISDILNRQVYRFIPQLLMCVVQFSCYPPNFARNSGHNLESKSKRMGALVFLYSLWLGLAAFWAVAAFQLQTTLLYIGYLIIENPSLRPTGWNTSTLSGINRCTFLLLGSLWLGLVIFSERYLRESLEEDRLLINAGRLLLIIGGIYGFSVALLYILS